jgi:hypothetical protein
MSQINAISKIVALDMLHNARAAMAEKRDDLRLAKLADAVGVGANDPLFKIMVLQHATVEHARDAQIALLEAAEGFKQQAARLSQERAISERARRPWELAKTFWMEIGLGLAAAAIFGMFIGVLLMKTNGVPAQDGRAAIERRQAHVLAFQIASANDTASAAHPGHS